jgi:hypothetical protein
VQQITEVQCQRAKVMMIGGLQCYVWGMTAWDAVVFIVVIVAYAEVVAMDAVEARRMESRLVKPGHTVGWHSEAAMHRIAR